jgi:hypothetical protein
VAAVSPLVLEVVVFVVILAIVLVGLFLWMSRHLRQRKAKILSELADKPELNQDRAFNRLAMARRESEILAGQGVDVRRAQELIAESQGAFDTRQYDRSYRVAQSAHEALVNARTQGARVAGGPPLASGGPGALTSSGSGPLPSSSGSPPPSARPSEPAIPKNRAESQFQLRVLHDELSAVTGSRAKSPNVAGAKVLADQAQTAFDKGDFNEAFRLALRGRRTLGGTLESLAPSPGAGLAAARLSANPNGGPPDAIQTADTLASAERCPDCGYPSLAGDEFCRGCGRPRTPVVCPSCGAARVADEAFCGRCGARFP